MSDGKPDSCDCREKRADVKSSRPENAPGRSALDYRVGTHGKFKGAMLARISQSRVLDRLRTRSDDDPSIALLDGWAAVLDVLSFYQERIVNESFLRTATERSSVLELARTIGYELRPGVAASAALAFTVEEAPQAPREARVPRGTKVQSKPRQDEKPQMFETVEDLHARAEWNVLRPRMRVMKVPGQGGTQVALAGTKTGLKPGDPVLLVGEEREADLSAENWDMRRVSRVEPVFTGSEAIDYTLVSFDRPLGKIRPYGPTAQNPRIFALRRHWSLFGYNAVPWKSLQSKVQELFPGGDGNEWPSFTLFDLVERKGLLGEYFSGPHLTGKKQRRLDAIIDVGALIEMPAGTVSARWSGLVRASHSSLRRISVESNGWVRLWLDGALVADSWGAKFKPGIVTADVHGSALYRDIRLEYSARSDKPKLRLLGRGNEVADEEAGYSLRPPEIHLASTDSGITSGSWIVMGQPSYQELYRVEEATGDARTGFMLTGKTTRLTLSGENLRIFNDQLRQADVFGGSEELPMTEQPRTDTVFGRRIELETAVTALEKGRRVIVCGRRVFARAEAETTLLLDPLEEGKPAAGPLLLEKGDTVEVADVLVSADESVKWTLVGPDSFPGTALVLAGALQLVQEEAVSCELAEIDFVEPGERERTTLVLREPLRHAYDRESVRIFGNVAAATHGESRSEVLGSGDASQPFQKFTLKQKPLTFVSAATANGTASTLDVRVNDVLWKEAPSFYGLGPHDRCYVTRTADDGTVTIEFGDGATGARPPTGVENIRASYRVGTGLAGNLLPEQISLLVTRPLGVKGGENPLPSTGGDDPETRDQARRNAPLTVLTLDRIVSLRDFEDFAEAFAGIGKAQATWVWSGAQRVVFITIAGPEGGELVEAQPPLSNLIPAIDAAREPTQAVQVGSSRPLPFSLSAKVLLKEGYLRETVHAAVRSALGERFSFARRNFGQAVTESEVLATMQGVAGLAAVDLDFLYLSGQPAESRKRLPADVASWDDGRKKIIPAQLLVLDPAGVELTERTP